MNGISARGSSRKCIYNTKGKVNVKLECENSRLNLSGEEELNSAPYSLALLAIVTYYRAASFRQIFRGSPRREEKVAKAEPEGGKGGWGGERDLLYTGPLRPGTTEHPQAHVLIPTNACRLLRHYSPDKAVILEAQGHGLPARILDAGVGLRFALAPGPFCRRYPAEGEKEIAPIYTHARRKPPRVFIDAFTYCAGKPVPTSSKSKRWSCKSRRVAEANDGTGKAAIVSCTLVKAYYTFSPRPFAGSFLPLR